MKCTEEQRKQQMVAYVRERAIDQIERALLNVISVSYQHLEWIDIDEVIAAAKAKVAAEVADVQREIKSQTGA